MVRFGFVSVAVVVFVAASGACNKPPEAPTPATATAVATAPPANATTIAISVDGEGYHPESAEAPAGQPVRLIFTRTTDEGCGQQVRFADLEIRRDLPLNEPVPIDITMPASGSVSFTCGMGMYRGEIVVR